MSQDPLAAMKRKQPRARGVFPEPGYARDWLAPSAHRAEQRLQDAVVRIYCAHALVQAEQRILEAEDAARLLKSLTTFTVAPSDSGLPHHPLSAIQSQLVDRTSANLLIGIAPEEVLAAAIRMFLRERLLEFADALHDVREALSELAAGHLTTAMLPTAGGQVVQPTSLGHYLLAQVGPLARGMERVREGFARLNQSPLGSGSGMSTAIPVRRGRASELLGFDGVIDNTFDAIVSMDTITEVISLVATIALESTRLIADLTFWARDDVGLLVPGDEYLHAGRAQPQRRDPTVLEHVRVQLASTLNAQASVAYLVGQQPSLGTDVARLESMIVADRSLDAGTRSYHLLAAVLRSAVVNRALFAHRTNRGFATLSELTDLLSVDYHLPRDDAMLLTERVAIEATEAGIESTTLTPEFVDAIALRTIGRELGIEPETLARCLAPKRFLERRNATGGPAPRAVSASIDRETFAARRDREWILEQRRRLAEAHYSAIERASEIIRDPSSATRRTDRSTIQ